jgi:hypothetical protein
LAEQAALEPAPVVAVVAVVAEAVVAVVEVAHVHCAALTLPAQCAGAHKCAFSLPTAPLLPRVRSFLLLLLLLLLPLLQEMVACAAWARRVPPWAFSTASSPPPRACSTATRTHFAVFSTLPFLFTPPLFTAGAVSSGPMAYVRQRKSGTLTLA